MYEDGSSFMVRKPCGCVVAVMAKSLLTQKKMIELLAGYPNGLIFQYVDDDFVNDSDWNFISKCTHKETPNDFLQDIGVDAERLNQYSVGDRMAIREAVKSELA